MKEHLRIRKVIQIACGVAIWRSFVSESMRLPPLQSSRAEVPQIP